MDIDINGYSDGYQKIFMDINLWIFMDIHGYFMITNSNQLNCTIGPSWLRPKAERSSKLMDPKVSSTPMCLSAGQRLHLRYWEGVARLELDGTMVVLCCIMVVYV